MILEDFVCGSEKFVTFILFYSLALWLQTFKQLQPEAREHLGAFSISLCPGNCWSVNSSNNLITWVCLKIVLCQVHRIIPSETCSRGKKPLFYLSHVISRAGWGTSLRCIPCFIFRPQSCLYSAAFNPARRRESIPATVSLSLHPWLKGVGTQSHLSDKIPRNGSGSWLPF